MITKRMAVRCAVSSAIVLAGLAVAVRRGAANAPASQYTIANGTVTDNVTGLVWQQATPAVFYTWLEAGAYCTSNAAALPGTGWRLPSMTELQSIVDDSRQDATIDPNAFPNAKAFNFWTSSIYLPGAAEAWYVDFGAGYSAGGSGSIATVRCVR